MNNINIGGNIKKYRLKQGLTQTQLSRLVDVTESMISQIERNIKCPTMRLGKCIADALGVTLNDLVAE